MKAPYWQAREPWGLRLVEWTPEAESNRTGLPLSDVLVERRRVEIVETVARCRRDQERMPT